jgi:hypothetical protein
MRKKKKRHAKAFATMEPKAMEGETRVVLEHLSRK